MNNKTVKRIMQIFGLFLIMGLASFSYKANQTHEINFTSTLDNNRLGKCPNSPNCVSSSESESSKNFVSKSIQVNKTPQELITYLERENCSLSTRHKNYFHFMCTSNVFKFIDDLEIFIDTDKSYHFRSASRIGYSDLGKNRKRVNKLKNFLEN